MIPLGSVHQTIQNKRDRRERW